MDRPKTINPSESEKSVDRPKTINPSESEKSVDRPKTINPSESEKSVDKSYRDIAFSCDDNGAKFLRVTVWSLLKHYKGDEPLRINVFEGFGGHSAESKAKLAEVVDGFNKAKGDLDFAFFSVRYHDVGAAIAPYAALIMNREKSRWNVFTWTPIFTPMLLADATGNVAHFDIDMLFNDDVSKILDLDLGDNLIAAVAEYGKGDPVITEAVWGKGILPSEAERYFNTGTIVFNAAKCREEKTWEKILAWYKDHYDIADRIEQDAWNALYWKRTKLLPLRWNFHDRLVKSYAKWNPLVKYWQGNPPVECLEAATNPAILHFWGPKKPWKPSHRPYRKLYHAAMRAVGQTPPAEQPFAFLHDWKNGRDLAKAKDLWQMMSGKVAPRNLSKAVRRALVLPFEWLAIGLGWLILPSLTHRMLLAVCDGLSAVMYRFDSRGRRLSLENLRIVEGVAPVRVWPNLFDPDKAAYDPTPREEIVIRGSYRNMVRTVGHAFWTCWKAEERVRAVGEVTESVRAFLAANKPAVTVSGHIGCWEILSQLAYLEGHRMMSVAKRIGTEGMTRLLMRARKSIGQEIVPAKGAFKSLMAGIRAGKSLGLLVDQAVSPLDGGVWVRFFKRPLPVSAAPAFFAAKARVPIIVAWSRPLKDGRYRCESVDEISADEARNIWRTTQRCARDLERVIRRHPSCWVLNYNLFRMYPNQKMLLELEERERTER